MNSQNSAISDTIVISPKKAWWRLGFKEIFRYKDLFYIFVWRDIKVRYKQTMVGVAWVLFQPLVTMAIFSVIFGKFAQIPSDGIPYFLFVYFGLIFWTFFSSALTNATNSLIDNESIVKKVYYPKIISPIASVVTASLDFFISFSFFLVLVVFLGIKVSFLSLFLFPFFFLLTFITAVGLGLFTSAFNVMYRDVRLVLPFFIQVLMFITPVIYPLSLLSPSYRYVAALNPLTSVIDSMRRLFFQTGQVETGLLLIGMLSSLLIFCCGLFYFKIVEDRFADII